ncbi:MAG TPA: hypothetical protein VF691_07970 [Cytophagaceae bacterium]
MKKLTLSLVILIAISHFSCDTNKTDVTNSENNMGQESTRNPNTNYNDKEDSDTSINMTSGGGTGTGEYKADSLVNEGKGGGQRAE